MIKKKVVTLIVLVIIFLTEGSVVAQQVHLYYDLNKDSTYYHWEGKRAKKTKSGVPTLRKGTTVLVHVAEYNDFVYDISVQEAVNAPRLAKDKLPIDSVSRGGSGFSSFSTGPLEFQQLTSGLSTALLSGFKNKLARQGARGVSDIAQQELTKKGIEEVTALQNLEKQAAQIQLALKKEARLLEESYAIDHDLIQLAHNWTIPPSEIRSQASEYIGRVFGVSGDQLTLQTVLDWDKEAVLSKLEAELIELKSSYQFHKSELGVLFYELSTQEGNVVQPAALPDMWDALQDDLVFEEGVNHQLKQIQRLKQNIKHLSPSYLKNVFERYQAIRAHNFMHTQIFSSTADVMELVITLTPKPRDTTIGSRGGERAPVYSSELDQPILKTRRIQLEQYNGLRITSSTGVGIARYFKEQELYTIRSGAIVAAEEEFIRPLLTSSIQIHSDKGRWLTLGATAGAGIPILGSGDNQSVSFHLGPSLVFGKTQSVVLNAGLISGKIRRLKVPLQVGDPFQGSVDSIPTELRSGFGWFVGLALNL
jgi:hypothetical protein